MTDDDVMKVAAWLRKKLPVGQGILKTGHMKRRIEYFVGEDFVNVLQGEEFTSSKTVETQLTKGDADVLAERMMKTNLFIRSDITNLDDTDLEVDDVLVPARTQAFLGGEAEFYTWIMPPSKTETLMKTGAMLGGVLFMCMIKVWPLWLKIGVWWVSLVFLIMMLSIIIIRLVLYALFSLVGIRGIWLLPNLLNDDIDFMDAFSPLWGKGINIEEYQQAQLKRLAAVRRRRGGQKEAPKEEKKEEEEEDATGKFDKLEDSSYSFRVGLYNIAGLFIFGIVLCNYFGFFMPDNIPDFVVSQVELWKEFPSLAPPDFDPETAAAEEEAKNKKPSLEDILKEVEEEEDEYKMDPILDRVDDDGDVDLLPEDEFPDVPDDDEDETI